MSEPSVFERVVAEVLCAMGSCDRPVEATHDGWHLAQARIICHALATSDEVREAVGEPPVWLSAEAAHGWECGVDAILAALDPEATP